MNSQLQMKQQKIKKLLTRFLFIYFVHLVIKGGDQSFGVFTDFTFRGFIFSVFFITYWLCIWYTAEYFNDKIQKKLKTAHLKNKKSYTFYLFSFHFVFGFFAAFFANWLYRTGDVYFFGNQDLWARVSFFNPELTLSLLTIYMMVFTFDLYYKSSIEQKEDQLKMEQLKKESTLAQYLNLKSQIEPRFLFNSLSVLSSLIHTDTDLASEFVLRLSRIIRYVIEKNEFLLVPLQDEIDFVNDYLFLMQTRFEQEIICETKIDKKLMGTCFVPPATLQTLVENAIKHNKFTKDRPLRIALVNDGKYLIVRNKLQLRNDSANSTKQGLENLKARFSHFTEHPVEIVETEDEFTVSFPLLTKEHYERFTI